MDTQTVEIIGRNILINQLVKGGIEVAQPIRDRGIDLIAYLDLEDSNNFISTPIQLKASIQASFGIQDKYSKISNLLLVFVWGLIEASQVQIFALTYQEALEIANAMGWTKTASWTKGSYITTAPSKKLTLLLKTYKMTPTLWRKKILNIGGLKNIQ